MKTIEQLQADHAKELSRLQAEHGIAQTMPLPPERVMVTGARLSPWVTYKTPTMRDALAIFQRFATDARIVNIEHARGTFTHLCPTIERGTQYARDEVLGDYAAYLRVHQGEGFGPDVSLVFFAEVAARLVRVCVDMEQGSARWWQYGARVVEHRHSRTDRLDSRTFHANDALNGYADKVVQYGSGDYGPIKKSADISYLFVADDGKACSVFSHLVGQLTNIADEFDPKATT